MKRHGLVFFLSFLPVLWLPGCASPRYKATGDVLLDMRNPDLRVRDRVAAAETLWSEMLAGERERDLTRRAMKDLAWSTATPIDVRVSCIAMLLDDPDPAGQEDARTMARLMLPTERTRSVVAVIASRAGQNQWRDMTSALVRSYSRPVDEVADLERAERIALDQLHPGRSIGQTIFEVFLEPGYDDTPAELRLNQRTRADVWNLLSRVDDTGQMRRSLIAHASSTSVPADARLAVDALERAFSDLAIIPRTGDELRWVESLRSGSAENQKWWSESTSAVGRLRDDQRTGLEIRHIEAVRWAGIHRPGLLASSRSQLLAELSASLEGREHYRRSAEKMVMNAPRKERLSDWQSYLVWGDLLAMLVIDEALTNDALRARLFEYVEIDRIDRTTEYGGIIEASEGEAFRSLLFRPRARDRTSDTEFVASEDMILASDRALLHYHLHVQRVANAEYAGPSQADLEYAATSGRSCVVFTSINADRLNVDFYQPGGAVIDMGTIVRPGS